jgi:hypothetical protein
MRVEPLLKADAIAYSNGKPLKVAQIATKVDSQRKAIPKNSNHTWLITIQFKQRLADFTHSCLH